MNNKNKIYENKLKMKKEMRSTEDLHVNSLKDQYNHKLEETYKDIQKNEDVIKQLEEEENRLIESVRKTIATEDNLREKLSKDRKMSPKHATRVKSPIE
jgi:DNA phosphorothioation-dependent restriction protein DptG